ncbi:MAG: 4a-hydroxytetrahydrobiopterin dehydratase [Pseudomonadales bacterium]
MTLLATEHCTLSYTKSAAATAQECKQWLQQLPDWVIEPHEGQGKLCLHFALHSYAQGVDVIAQIAALADAEQHHPDIVYRYGSLSIYWWTHHCRALHKNDFIMAAKVSALLNQGL